MKTWDTVAIVGVGLIGGSIGLALRRGKLARHVVGIGRRKTTLAAAKQRGAVTQFTTEVGQGVAKAEIVVVCTPVEQIASYIRQAASHCPEGTLLTDAGSTKQRIVSELEGMLPRAVQFIGSHPLAGSEKTGAQNARADLFDGRTVVITPSRRAKAERVTELARFWAALGADVVQMTPAAHDEAVAATSHLPHLVASVLAASTAKKHLPLVAGGWLDTTRVAAGDVAMWRQIFNTNREHTLAALAKLETSLSDFRKALEDKDERQLTRILKKGKDIRDAAGGAEDQE